MRDWFNIHLHAWGTSPTVEADTNTASTPSLPVFDASEHTHCAAVQDDFHWWHTTNDESEHSGKLMLVDSSFTSLTSFSATASTTDEQVIQVNLTNFPSIFYVSSSKYEITLQLNQVFFDDNIERDRAHIVDVRDARTYEPVPFGVSQGRYLRRVDPYQAILDKEYYVHEVQRVLALYA